jgi:hypothetical protein
MRGQDIIAALAARAQRSTRGLAGQMLALTVAAAVVVDALLLAPSLGNFHDAWLRDRAEVAYGAALVAEASAASREQDLLAVLRASRIVLERPGAARISLQSEHQPAGPLRIVDLRETRVLQPVTDGLSMLTHGRTRDVRVIAAPYEDPAATVEVVLKGADLRADLFRHAKRALIETLVASLAVGALLYAALMVLVVRRIRRMTGFIEAFGKRPQDATVATAFAGHDDELGRAEVALVRMGEDVRAALLQKERLASLGAAVAKIAHDLRNSLGTAQLVSDRLGDSADPTVRQSAPRLARAIARAVALAEAALRFGKADEPQLLAEEVDVRAALDEAADEALSRHADVEWTNAAPPLRARADRDALHRILSNLIRNAAEVQGGGERRRIAASASRTPAAIEVEIADNGPGIAGSMRERLFEPFASQRSGGLGLGLTIARELARGMGGDVVLVDADGAGTKFRVSVPAVAHAEAV